jgi:hypothetical protein
MNIGLKSKIIRDKQEREIKEIIKREIKLRFTKLRREEIEKINDKMREKIDERIINSIYNTRIKNIIMGIKKLFNNPELMDKKIRNIYEEAKKNDDYALVNQKEMEENAKKYEKQIEEILKINKIKYKTQEEITEEQKREYGNAKATPDFVIISELYINNKKINWIDVKNYYGENDKFIIKSLSQQKERNENFFNEGCFIFKLGYNELLNKKYNFLVFSYEI